MSEEHLRPSKIDIDRALHCEQLVTPEEKDLYLECMNNRPMSVRTEPRDQRSGCILTNVFISCVNLGNAVKKSKNAK